MTLVLPIEVGELRTTVRDLHAEVASLRAIVERCIPEAEKARARQIVGAGSYAYERPTQIASTGTASRGAKAPPVLPADGAMAAPPPGSEYGPGPAVVVAEGEGDRP